MLQVGAMVCLTLAILMTYYSFARKTYPGFQHWTIGIVNIGVGAVLVSLRKFLPDFITIIIGNLLVVTMPFLLVCGLNNFLNLQWKLTKINLYVLSVFLLNFLWWTYITPDLASRIVVLSLTMTFFFAQALYIVLNHVPLMLGKQEWSLVVALAMSTFASAFRAIITQLSINKVEFINNSEAIHSTGALLIILSVISSTLSILILNSHRMENDLKKANIKIEKLANLDELSSIFNRRYFNNKLKQEFKRHQRTSSPISLIMLDIDCFKLYNDTYGHLCGDECIKSVADILSKAGARPSDITARYGGEEFVLLLPETDSNGAYIIAERIQEKLKNKSIPHKTSTVTDIVTLTIGISTMIPTKSTPPEMLVRYADQSLYEGKKKGKNQIQIFQQTTTS